MLTTNSKTSAEAAQIDFGEMEMASGLGLEPMVNALEVLKMIRKIYSQEF